MPEWVVDLSDVKPASVRSAHIPPGEYGAKILSATAKDTKYGNGIEMAFQVLDEGDSKGARLSNLMFIPDATMAKALADDPKRKPESTENFLSMMASKWVSLMLAGGLKPGKHDLRKVADKLVGKAMLIVVEDSRKKKPTDPTFSNINATMPLPEGWKPTQNASPTQAMTVITSEASADDAPAAAVESEGSSDVDDFDLDEIA